jgi:uncharacterized membrane protein
VIGIRLRPVLVGRVALLGAASGSRSTVGLAAVALTARSGVLARPAVQRACLVAIAAELVIDKLPITPSRLQARGLISRAVTGGLCGGLIARRDSEVTPAELVAAVGLGAVVAVGGAVVGAGWRTVAAGRGIGGRFGAAIAEDVVALALAAAGVTRS